MDDDDRMRRLLERSVDAEGRTDKQMLHARGVLSDDDMFGGDDVTPEPLGGLPLYSALGFSATGVLDDRQYWVAVLWGGELDDAVALRGRDAEWLTPALTAHEGEGFPNIRSGALVRLRMDDAASVLYALSALSLRFEWHGDQPRRRQRT